MKKISIMLFLLISVILSNSQNLIQGKVEVFNDEITKSFLFENNGTYYVLDRLYYSNVRKDSQSPKIIAYKIEGNVLKKSEEIDLSIPNKILKAEEYFFAGSKANSCVLYGYSLELVDFSFTIKKGTKGQLNVEKYDLQGALKASLKVDKKIGPKKEYFFQAMLSQNGDYIGIINNNEYMVYSTESFTLLQTFTLNNIPDNDRSKSKFYVLNDGSLVYLTMSNPVFMTKCDMKTSSVLTSQIKFTFDNNFSPYFQLSDDQSFLLFSCIFNDQKNSESNTILAKGFQIVGVDLEDLKVTENQIYNIDANLKESMEFKKEAKDLAILGMHKTKDGFLLAIHHNPVQYMSHSTAYFQKDIAFIKIDKSGNEFKVQKRDDTNADTYFIDDSDKTFLIYSNISKFKPTGGVTSKSKLCILEVTESLELSKIYDGDFSRSAAKMVDLKLFKANAKTYFMFNLDDEKMIPMVFTIN